MQIHMRKQSPSVLAEATSKASSRGRLQNTRTLVIVLFFPSLLSVYFSSIFFPFPFIDIVICLLLFCPLSLSLFLFLLVVLFVFLRLFSSCSLSISCLSISRYLALSLSFLLFFMFLPFAFSSFAFSFSFVFSSASLSLWVRDRSAPVPRSSRFRDISTAAAFGQAEKPKPTDSCYVSRCLPCHTPDMFSRRRSLFIILFTLSLRKLTISVRNTEVLSKLPLGIYSCMR